jgi:hypothetical protein
MPCEVVALVAGVTLAMCASLTDEPTQNDDAAELSK